MRSISLIGDGGVQKGSELYKVAEEIGYLVAKRGYVLICGGLFGVMEAGAKGAKKAGGLTIGILPEYDSPSNQYIDIRIPTGMGQARNVLVVSSSDIVVAVGGSYGTLSEIGHALKLDKKVIGYRTWEIEGIKNFVEAEDFLNYFSNFLNET
ncbi:TIGR00725 family protein [Desulfurobacterium thermolithotrophum]|uniref:TIGR00725 family protein n=1 Tax=Desulfurobacterium thermolithotrophum TaxID=64160 RepID=UPI0013D11990|nr:TIGR00725 family protein [Desulfurobacterium thermolithotrophum]